MARMTNLFTERELQSLARTAAETVNEMDHGDLLGFLSTTQIEDAEKAYRLLVEADMGGDE